MTYHLPLNMVTIALGLLALAGGIVAALKPGRIHTLLAGLPRNYRAGVVLMLVGIAWMDAVVYTIDLAEMSQYRYWLILFFSIVGIMTIIYLPDFLFSRALGIVLLLATEVLLSATFPETHPARHIVTVIGYIWAILGMCFVAAPYLLRDLIERFHPTPGATRRVGMLKAGGGLLLVVLGLTCFT